MSIELIKTGAVVDDSTGDYLRQGAEKINKNFNETYSKLGDGSDLMPAGAWSEFAVSSSENAKTLSFGDAIIINTTVGDATITLPVGSASDIGKTIKIRDSYGTWKTNKVSIACASTDTIKGSTDSVDFTTKFMDLEFVYTSPSRWEYKTQTRLDGVYLGDSPSVIKKSWISTDDQRDFDFFTDAGGEYNTDSVEVFRRGNLLYYGEELNSNSDYGSYPDPSISIWAESTEYSKGDYVKVANTSDDWDYDYYSANSSFTSGSTFNSSNWTQLNAGFLMPLDGKTIRLELAAEEGDPICVKTLQSDLSSYKTAVYEKTIKIIDTNNLHEQAVSGNVVQVESGTTQLKLTDFGFNTYTAFNVDHINIWVNGKKLVKANEAGTGFTGSGITYDFDPVQDDAGNYNTINFGFGLKDGDLIFIQWFSSQIGTILEWDSEDDEDDLKSKCDERYLQNIGTIDRINNIEYSDPTNPSADTTSPDEDENDIRVINITSLFKSIYPVGSLYFNANNAANPKDLMGFGTWVRYAQGKAIVGWQDKDSEDNYDPTFSYNDQYKDGSGNSMPVAGGTIGSSTNTLTTDNIPPLKSGFENQEERDDTNQNQQYALVSRSAYGDITLSGCQTDPDQSSIDTSVYSEEPITVNAGVAQSAFNIIQPSILVNVWVRTA